MLGSNKRSAISRLTPKPRLQKAFAAELAVEGLGALDLGPDEVVVVTLSGAPGSYHYEVGSTRELAMVLEDAALAE